MEKAKLLVVEDEPVVAMDIQASLEDMGYAVTSLAASGTQAIEEAERDRPDLVLMDILLKEDMTGIEAAHYISTKFDIPIIYLTANSDTETLEKAKVAEPFGYLIKPFNNQELRANIEMALYRHRMEKERQKMAEELQAQKEELKVLRGLLPICSYCKNIQDDEGYWEKVESYINRHTSAELSHGICPGCAKKHFPQINWDEAE
jgi:CheY-like chemotaxis protein